MILQDWKLTTVLFTAADITKEKLSHSSKMQITTENDGFDLQSEWFIIRIILNLFCILQLFRGQIPKKKLLIGILFSAGLFWKKIECAAVKSYILHIIVKINAILYKWKAQRPQKHKLSEFFLNGKVEFYSSAEFWSVRNWTNGSFIVKSCRLLL